MLHDNFTQLVYFFCTFCHKLQNSILHNIVQIKKKLKTRKKFSEQYKTEF